MYSELNKFVSAASIVILELLEWLSPADKLALYASSRGLKECLFANMKWKLSRKISMKIVENNAFRNLILKRFRNPKVQLSVDVYFENDSDHNELIEVISEVAAVSISTVLNSNVIKLVSNLDMLSSNITAVTVSCSGYFWNDLIASLKKCRIKYLNIEGSSKADFHKLAGLTELERLVVRSYPLNSFSALGRLVKLTHLDLGGRYYHNFPDMTQLKNLRCLSLRYSRMTSLEPFRYTLSLQTLDISESLIDSLDAISGLIYLTEVDCCQVPIADLTPLTNLSRLQFLQLGATKITDLSPIRDLKKLHTLMFYTTKVDDIRPLEGLTLLEELHMTGTSIASLEPISRLTRLRILSFGYTHVADINPLRNLVHLEHLQLFKTPVQDFSPIYPLAPRCYVIAEFPITKVLRELGMPRDSSARLSYLPINRKSFSE